MKCKRYNLFAGCK